MSFVVRCLLNFELIRDRLVANGSLLAGGTDFVIRKFDLVVF